MTPENLLKWVLYINLTIIWYFLFINLCYVILLFTSIPDIFARFKETLIGNINFFMDSRATPPVCAIIPAYNEAAGILHTIESVLLSNYKNLQILIVNDGSTDKTMQILQEKYDLVNTLPIIMQKIKTVAAVKHYYVSKKYPNLTVIDKEHSGKSDSLNIGINACTAPIFATIDSDSIVEPDAIPNLVFSMMSKPHTIAEGGSVYVLNGCKYEEGRIIEQGMSKHPFIAMQTCEYLRAFLFGRTGWNIFNGPLILSGAITLFERQAVIDVQGYRTDSPGEDMEVVVCLHEHMRKNDYPYRIGFVFSAVVWTDVPDNMNALWSQRDRWHRGLIDSLFRHLNMFFNPQYGATGLISYPFQFLGEFLGPLIEFAGYFAVVVGMYFNIIDWHFAILFFIVTWGFATILTLGTMLISVISFNKYKRIRDVIYLFLLVIFESFGYRQIISLCRVIATFRYNFMKIFHS